MKFFLSHFDSTLFSMIEPDVLYNETHNIMISILIGANLYYALFMLDELVIVEEGSTLDDVVNQLIKEFLPSSPKFKSA